jgi:2-iminobutanoate/2-iminopropanoate deaminase
MEGDVAVSKKILPSQNLSADIPRPSIGGKMNPKKPVHSERAPKAIGPYSPAIRSGDWIFTSGQLGLDPQTGELAPGGTAVQTRRALENCALLIEAGGATMADVVKTTVFLLSLDDFGQMNSVYAEFFNQDPPARSTVQVAALLKGGAVEIECVARLRSSDVSVSRRKQ